MSFEAHVSSSGKASGHSKIEVVVPFVCFSILPIHTSGAGHILLMCWLICLSSPLNCNTLDNRKLIYFIFEYLKEALSLTHSYDGYIFFNECVNLND